MQTKADLILEDVGSVFILQTVCGTQEEGSREVSA